MRRAVVPAGAPRVSVVIPLYNLRRYVTEAIESVLAQTLPPEDVEVIVVDDGSTDGGGDVARGFAPRVQCVRQPNRGLSAARNTGIRAARAPFLTFLDADDRLLPDKLARELDVFATHPDVDIVYSGFHYVDERLQRLPQRGWSQLEGDLFPALVLGNRLHVFQALVVRERVEDVGGFDESLTSAEDWDLWLRLARAGVRWACLDEPLAEYRIRPDAMHRNAARMAENCVRVLDKVFADPALPADVVETRARAYHNAYLTAAINHYRGGDPIDGARWFRAAAVMWPESLVDVATLTRFARGLLPVGSQRSATMATEWRWIGRVMRSALRDLFAMPDLEPEIRRLRARAYGATCRTIAPIVWRRAKMVARGIRP